MQNVYDHAAELTELLQKKYDTINQYSHLYYDISRIRIDFLTEIQCCHAEMAYNYLNGISDDEELASSVKESINVMQDFWDNRFNN